MNQSRYVFHSDPSHGWLVVPMHELRSLGIADRITPYSHQSRDGKVAYLEEDCDLGTFARAKGWEPDGSAPIFSMTPSNRDSFIRHLPSYKGAA